jgi:hypothetical protein
VLPKHFRVLRSEKVLCFSHSAFGVMKFKLHRVQNFLGRVFHNSDKLSPPAQNLHRDRAIATFYHESSRAMALAIVVQQGMSKLIFAH